MHGQLLVKVTQAGSHNAPNALLLGNPQHLCETSKQLVYIIDAQTKQMTRDTNDHAILLLSMALKRTYDAIQRCSELMRDHGQKLLLGLHADFQVLDLLQPVAH